MKIFLVDGNGKWKLYEGTFDELKPEFDKRKIIIGSDCSIGSGSYIGRIYF